MLQSWLQQIKGATSSVLERYTSQQKRTMMIVSIIALACLALIAWYAFRPKYVTIMTGLDNKSIGQIQTQLQTLKIPMRIVGSSVDVPSKDANTARVQLAMAGLPKTGYIGYSSVKSSFGMTQGQFNLEVLNALQQSLNLTIESISGVESAQVHIVMPTQDVFVSQPTSPAKASVFVQLGAGVQLSQAQVHGIQELVAHAVQSLNASEVTVTDQNGVTLSGNNTPNSTFTSVSELQTRNQMQQAMQQRLLSGLEQIVGSGNVILEVHPNVTFNQSKIYYHTVVPVKGQQTGLPSSQQTLRSTSNSTGGQGITSVSTKTGVTNSVGTTGAPGKSSSAETKTSTAYDNSYTNTTKVLDPIQNNGYSVGVFLNSSDKAITPAVLNQVRTFVQNAAGDTGTSKNLITVSQIPFNKATPYTPSPNQHLTRNILIGLGAASLLTFGVVTVLRRRKAKKNPEKSGTPSAMESMNEYLKPGADGAMLQLETLAKDQPDAFSGLLRNWIHESNSET